MSGHTPGPWTVSGHFWVKCQDGRTICVTEFADYADSVAVNYRKANAILIAAAPQMLEALRELVGEADSPAGWEGHRYGNSLGFQMAREAIAKAEGK